MKICHRDAGVFIGHEPGAADTRAAIGASEILGAPTETSPRAYTAFGCQEVRDRGSHD